MLGAFSLSFFLLSTQLWGLSKAVHGKETIINSTKLLGNIEKSVNISPTQDIEEKFSDFVIVERPTLLPTYSSSLRTTTPAISTSSNLLSPLRRKRSSSPTRKRGSFSSIENSHSDQELIYNLPEKYLLQDDLINNLLRNLREIVFCTDTKSKIQKIFQETKKNQKMSPLSILDYKNKKDMPLIAAMKKVFSFETFYNQQSNIVKIGYYIDAEGYLRTYEKEEFNLYFYKLRGVFLMPLTEVNKKEKSDSYKNEEQAIAKYLIQVSQILMIMGRFIDI